MASVNPNEVSLPNHRSAEALMAGLEIARRAGRGGQSCQERGELNLRRIVRPTDSQKLQELIRRGSPRDLAAAQELMKALAGAVSAFVSMCLRHTIVNGADG